MKKLITLDELLQLKKDLVKAQKKISWTNGCFDFMHAGHVDYLERAKKYGDLLVVGMNSDRSVKRYKGDLRPICNEIHRAQVLNALCCVDYIVIFEEKTPIRIIEKLQPDFYIKGGDYTLDTIDQDERRVVENYSGEIKILPEVEGISTTIIIEKIRDLLVAGDSPEN
ncbi:D-glycero-beta-D-manno-heptose 1-phosphate adenylyltransferase [candidate division KSB1 bacterium]|nr:D-glycero-beta-D-manno-heptose 1-phosphate adenylyltransferase [candidate division KSB1 bacterium]MBL7095264.1 D-glycero-beta-D-manno-heptose 1-phosphate adenylyltransferase [candidate division KSB1 bacterium]